MARDIEALPTNGKTKPVSLWLISPYLTNEPLNSTDGPARSRLIEITPGNRSGFIPTNDASTNSRRKKNRTPVLCCPRFLTRQRQYYLARITLFIDLPQVWYLIKTWISGPFWLAFLDKCRQPFLGRFGRSTGRALRSTDRNQHLQVFADRFIEMPFGLLNCLRRRLADQFG